MNYFLNKIVLKTFEYQEMKGVINIPDIIELVQKQEPDREDIIFALKNATGGKWEGKSYYVFVDTKNANKKGAEWQFKENIVLEDDALGTIVIDYLKDNRIGGIEFLDFEYR